MLHWQEKLELRRLTMQIKIEDADGYNLTVGHWYKVLFTKEGCPYVEDDYGEMTAVYDYQIAETE